MTDPSMVTIPLKEYAELQADRDWLHCLEAAGVDNWDGYSYAHQIRRDTAGDEEED